MLNQGPTVTDRLLIRERPPGLPIMHQSWGKLLFMHWQLPVGLLRPFIPERLTIDTFEGQAWIGVTPFTVWDARPVFTPPLPWLSEFHEINVRTYVHLDGVPGVWFFSLDANSRVAVTAARTFFHLPYYNATINLEQQNDRIIYTSSREEEMSLADFKAVWTIGPALPKATSGSLEFFLIERYCLYTVDAGKLYRCRIFHQPWPLSEAKFSTYRSSMIEGNGLPAPTGEPLLHCGGPVSVEVWPLEEL